MLRFAYNIVGLAIPEKYLQAALNVMNIMFNEYSLKIIAAKTKILMLYKKNISSINIAVESIVWVDYFKYSGGIITENGWSTKKIKSEIGQAKKNTFIKTKKLLTSKNLNIFILRKFS